MDFSEIYCKRKKGQFGYAEFVRFVNSRGAESQPEGARTIDPAATLSQVVESLNQATRRVSVSASFKVYDKDDDGKLSIAEFTAAIQSLGFELSDRQNRELFDAFDEDGSGEIDLVEFSRTIVNPNRNPKLGVTHRRSPGGESTIPLGASTQKGEPELLKTGRFVAPPGGASTVNFAEDNHAPIQANQKQPGPSYSSTINFSEEALPGDIEVVRPARTPYNGHNQGQIDFAGDHGASADIVATRVTKHPQSNVTLAHDGDASHRANTDSRVDVKPSPGGTSSISFVPTNEPMQAARPLTAHVHPAGGRSSVSFNQDDVLPRKSSTRVLASPGGRTAVDLTMDYSAPSGPKQSGPRTAGIPSSIDLSFDPLSTTKDGQPLRPNVAGITQSPGGNSSVRFGLEQEGVATKLREISDAVYTKGRLRHTFQEFNVSNPKGSKLSCADLKAGIEKLSISLSDEEFSPIFARFDKDNDGMLTYSEFVRMLATKG